jgi:hypothetical protein
MYVEQQQVKNLENAEIFKTIEIPAEEIKSLRSIFDFVDKISLAEYERFNGPIQYPVGTGEKIQELFQEKKTKLEENQTLAKKEKDELRWFAKREAEYEACADVIDYKNEQLRKLTDFIESQKIWKTKFSTASNVGYSKYTHENFQTFIADLKKSEEYHKRNSFAGQNFNSIYYISNSGVSFRINMSELHPNGDIESSIQPLVELSIYVDEITDPDTNEVISKNDSEEFPSKIASFDPKIGYRVEEFGTNDFRNHEKGDFSSKIQVLKSNDKIIIKDFDASHSGHYINKIYFSNSEQVH